MRATLRSTLVSTLTATLDLTVLHCCCIFFVQVARFSQQTASLLELELHFGVQLLQLFLQLILPQLELCDVCIFTFLRGFFGYGAALDLASASSASQQLRRSVARGPPWHESTRIKVVPREVAKAAQIKTDITGQIDRTHVYKLYPINLRPLPGAEEDSSRIRGSGLLIRMPMIMPRGFLTTQIVTPPAWSTMMYWRNGWPSTSQRQNNSMPLSSSRTCDH